MVGAIILMPGGVFRAVICAETDLDPNVTGTRPVRSWKDCKTRGAAQDFIERNSGGRGMGKSSAPSRG